MQTKKLIARGVDRAYLSMPKTEARSLLAALLVELKIEQLDLLERGCSEGGDVEIRILCINKILNYIE